MPIQDLGIAPLVQGMNAGTQLRELAMREDLARRAQEEAQYKMGKERGVDSAKKALIAKLIEGQNAPPDTVGFTPGMSPAAAESLKSRDAVASNQKAEDIIRMALEMGKDNPDALGPMMDILKVFSGPVRDKILGEELNKKLLENKLKTQGEIDVAVGKERATYPDWLRKETVKQQIGLETKASENEMDFTKSGELKKLDERIRNSRPPESKPILRANLDGGVDIFLVDKNDEGIVLGKMPSGSTDYTFTDKYIPWKLGQDGERLMDSVRNDPAVPMDKKTETAIKMLEEGTAPLYILKREREAKAKKPQAPGAKPIPEPSVGVPPPLVQPQAAANIMQSPLGKTDLEDRLLAQAKALQADQDAKMRDVSGEVNPFATESRSAPVSLFPTNQPPGDPTSIGNIAQSIQNLSGSPQPLNNLLSPDALDAYVNRSIGTAASGSRTPMPLANGSPAQGTLVRQAPNIPTASPGVLRRLMPEFQLGDAPLSDTEIDQAQKAYNLLDQWKISQGR